MSTGVWVLLAAVVLALAFGAYRALTDGRFRGTHRVRDAGRESTGSRVPEDPRLPEERPRNEAASRRASTGSLLADTPWADQLGERATLLQFSSAFCAPCRATRRVLEQVTDLVEGVAHVEVDAEHHLDVVRRLGVMRTPTTLVLDHAGAEVTRATGAPTKEQVLAALGAVS